MDVDVFLLCAWRARGSQEVCLSRDLETRSSHRIQHAHNTRARTQQRHKTQKVRSSAVGFSAPFSFCHPDDMFKSPTCGPVDLYSARWVGGPVCGPVGGPVNWWTRDGGSAGLWPGGPEGGWTVDLSVDLWSRLGRWNHQLRGPRTVGQVGPVPRESVNLFQESNRCACQYSRVDLVACTPFLCSVAFHVCCIFAELLPTALLSCPRRV